MTRVQIEFQGSLVKVRLTGGTSGDRIRYWQLLWPGQIHSITGFSYRRLKEIGEGIYTIEN